jgi:hypothetical protein
MARVSAPEPFLFKMKIAGPEQFNRVLEEVAATVFRQVGCTPQVAADLLKGLNAAVVAGADEGAGFDVQFCAEGTAVDVTVSVGNREIWRASHQIS